jgi:hypothetical protein
MPGGGDVRLHEARERLLEAALSAAAVDMEGRPMTANTDAERELHDDLLTAEVAQYARLLVEAGKIDQELPTAEAERSIRNQVIGYMKGKAMARRDGPTARTAKERADLGREIAAFQTVAELLETEASEVPD